jgi:hypothetical protein
MNTSTNTHGAILVGGLNIRYRDIHELSRVEPKLLRLVMK